VALGLAAPVELGAAGGLAMSLCLICGYSTSGNRIMCDFLHRGVVREVGG